MKIYNDGAHYCASFVVSPKQSRNKVNYASSLEFVSKFYFEARSMNFKGAVLYKYIKERYENTFGYMVSEKYIIDKVRQIRHNLGVRIKRFNRKVYMNRWNYFVTFTYDDSKMTEEDFRKKLRRCLSNLKTRRGWLFLGCFERAPETGRLHCHGLIYCPPGEMIGRIVEKKDYSTAKHCMQVIHQNSFFAKKFGRNDFFSIDDYSLKASGYIDYILKYIDKSGEKIISSRGIPAEIIKEVFPADIASDFFDFVQKYVLFDDVVNYDRDIKRYKPVQMNIFT